MDRKLTKKEYLFLSSMLFGLFFGAGNLIFPALMGQMAAAQMWPAAFGFLVTGVGLPLLGIVAMGISRSNGLFDMASRVSRPFSYFFTVALYLTIGPFFAIPRTATVSFSIGVAGLPFLPDAYAAPALFVFSLLFFLAVLWFSLRPNNILTWVGKILNPLFLVVLGILVFAALLSPMGTVSSAAAGGNYATNSFFTGFLEGYNTMDALASLAFGIVMIDAIHGLGVTDKNAVAGSVIGSGLLSMLLMAAIYIALTVIGAQSRALYDVSADGGAALYTIAQHYFGSIGALLLAVMITLACLKTSVGLVTSCAGTFGKLFPHALSYRAYAILFSVVSFLIANVGLNNIIAFSIPVLMFLYPLTITLILLSLFGACFQHDRRVYGCVIGFTMAAAVFDFLGNLPSGLFSALHLAPITAFAERLLPFYKNGMGWLVPAGIGLAIGLILHVARPQKTTSKKGDTV